jgi:hypothetical protein
MTNEQAIAKNQQYSHLSLETIAYYDGRSCVEDNGKVWECEFTLPVLVKGWKDGVRSMKAEIRLDRDTEWDND